MRVFENPANYFFRQADQPPHDFEGEARGLMEKLQGQSECTLCLQAYNFAERLPRILVHCGHTFCESCVARFHQKGKVRCPQCHKLVKHVPEVACLPINHSIFTGKVRALQALHPLENFQDPRAYLLEKFQEGSRRAKDRGLPLADPETGLPFCLTHADRVEHFYCHGHLTLACRVCAELAHQGPACQLTELYDVPSIELFLAEHAQHAPPSQQSSMLDFFEEEL
jgi:hypothetical protein